jgi:hypothetical protein
LVAFAALERVVPGGRVIFIDIAQRPADRCRRLAAERGAHEGAAVVRAPLDALHGVADASVDAVLERLLADSVAADGSPRRPASADPPPPRRNA